MATPPTDQSERSTPTFLPPGLLSRWIFDRPGIWQMDLVDSSALASFAKERSLATFHSEHIRKLWQAGLVRADLVSSSDPLDIDGLVSLAAPEESRWWYGDARAIPLVPTLVNLLRDTPAPGSNVVLHFHPFRSLILWDLLRWTEPSIAAFQPMLNSDGYFQLLDYWLNQHLATPPEDYQARLEYLTGVVELTIACEPCVYSQLFAHWRRPAELSAEQAASQLRYHENEIINHVRNISGQQLVHIYEDLCWSARILDENSAVHSMLRLSVGEYRIRKLRGRLGGAMCLLTMAEIVRRFVETALDIQLPEEDDIGYGPHVSRFKKELYGSTRLFDGNRTTSLEFLRTLGLDHGVRVRWYFEGDTELGALEYALGNNPSVELINLAGQVVQSKRKGVAFSESLQNDITAQIFSFVSIDHDREDYVQAVRAAIKADEICGVVFFSKPDFEFANFTASELADVLWTWARELGCTAGDEGRFRQELRIAKTNTELFRAAKKFDSLLWRCSKGKEWGAKLMSYALKHPEITSGVVTTEDRRRPIIRSLYDVAKAVSSYYGIQRREYRVDPATGYMVKRMPDRTE